MSGHRHGDWDLGYFCNRLVMRDGDAEVCGFRLKPPTYDLAAINNIVDQISGASVFVATNCKCDACAVSDHGGHVADGCDCRVCVRHPKSFGRAEA